MVTLRIVALAMNVASNYSDPTTRLGMGCYNKSLHTGFPVGVIRRAY